MKTYTYTLLAWLTMMGLMSAQLFWSDDSANLIQMGNADGSGSPTTILSGLSAPRGVGVDSANSTVYYTEHVTSTLSRVNINGTGNEVVVSASGAGSRGLSLDLVNTEVYWASFTAGTISKADYSLALPTTGTAVLSSRDVPTDVVLDVAGGKCTGVKPDQRKVFSALT